MGVRLVISMVLLLLPSLLWLCFKQLYSPWWLENFFSTPMLIVVIYFIMMIAVIRFISIELCIIYLLINFLLASFFNNAFGPNDISGLNQNQCEQAVKIFQFNMKYVEKRDEIAELMTFLLEERYDLITLQGVSQQFKVKLIETLSPYYLYFINGENRHLQVFTDQLVFSRFPFFNVNYYKSNYRSYVISSQWRLADKVINLHTLHPPSPRSEALWQIRNKVLYQLKNRLNRSSKNVTMIIGDLNISKHSNRINVLAKGMNTFYVNSWPNKAYIFPFSALAIDHFWLSKSETICMRKRIDKFYWSDHYAIDTEVAFNK